MYTTQTTFIFTSIISLETTLSDTELHKMISTCEELIYLFEFYQDIYYRIWLPINDTVSRIQANLMLKLSGDMFDKLSTWSCDVEK